MGGLLVLFAIALFLAFCWFVSGVIVRDKSNKNYQFKRVVVFLIPALLPLNIQIIEYVLFRQACNEAVVYFPHNKPKVPIAIVTGFGSKNDGRYFDGVFKYIAAPHHLNDRPINLEKSIQQFSDYIVYPYKSRPLEGAEREQLLDSLRYAFIYDSRLDDNNWFSHRTEYYVYDFLLERKISRVVKIFPRSHSQSIVGYIHAKFNHCPNKAYFDYDRTGIIKNTFIMEND